MTNLPPDPSSPESADLADRLRALGQDAVDPAVASAHLTAMAAVGAGPNVRSARGRFVHAKVAAAFAAGLVLGGTGAGIRGRARQHAARRSGRYRRACRTRPAGWHSSLDRRMRRQDLQESRSVRLPGRRPSLGVRETSQVDEKHDKSKGKHEESEGRRRVKGAGEAANGCGKPPWAGKGNHEKKTPTAVAARRAACGDDGPTPSTTRPRPGTAAPKTSTTTATTTTTPSDTTTTTTTRRPAHQPPRPPRLRRRRRKKSHRCCVRGSERLPAGGREHGSAVVASRQALQQANRHCVTRDLAHGLP